MNATENDQLLAGLNDGEEAPVRDNSEDNRLCKCCVVKQYLIFIFLLLTFDLLWSCYEAWRITNNEYFTEFHFYFYGFCLLLLPLFIAFILFSLYFCAQASKDDTHARERLPLAIILALTTAVLISLWVVVYIYCIYPDDEVYIGGGHKAEDGDEETNYTKTSKGMYVLNMIFNHLVFAIYYSFLICMIQRWVELNKGYKKSS